MEYKYLKYLTHSDLSPLANRLWEQDNGKTFYYLRNGVKTTVSQILLSAGVLGIYEATTHNQYFTTRFGADGLIASILALCVGIIVIWGCDRISEHHMKRVKEQNYIQTETLRNTLSKQSTRIEELSREVAKQKANQSVRTEMVNILQEELDDCNNETHRIEKKLENPEINYTKFMEDMLE
jgi:uncharacterized coiled-coil protein SlyX